MSGADSVLVIVVSQHAMNWIGGLVIAGMVMLVVLVFIWRAMEMGR